MVQIAIDKLTSGKVLLHNSIINLIIQGGPALVAFFTLPALLKGLGEERFGILTLIWAIIGASSILDFGLGHALTQFVAKKLGMKDIDELQNYIITALVIIFLLGIAAAILVCLATPFIVINIIHTPKQFIPETINSFYLLAITIPLLMLNISLVGLLESWQKFSVIGLLKLPVIFSNYIAPLFILHYSKSLFIVVIALVLGRFASCTAYLIFCMRILSTFSGKIKLKLSYIKPLITYGSWLTLSNIINTIIVNIDRFFIAGMISATVVAYYTTPLEVLTKIWIIPNAIMSVMFPAFSAEFFNNKARARKMYIQSFKTVFIMLLPICLLFFLFSKPGLSMWIGLSFANKSYLIAQIIAIGVFLQGLNIVSYGLVQATGKSDIQAKIHLIEFPIYLLSLWLFIKYFGTIGAAYAWLLRIVIDFILFKAYSLSIIGLSE